MDYPNLSSVLILATIVYASLGVAILMISIVVFDKIFKLNLHKELVKDQNTAFGMVIAGMAIGISIIIAASII